VVLTASGLLGLVLIIAGVASGWVTWLLVLLVLLVVIVLVVVGFRADRPGPMDVAPTQIAPAPPPPPPNQQASVSSVALPSSVPEFHFLFAATITWRNLTSWHGNPAGLAVELIVSRAREVAAAQPPTMLGVAQAMLNSLLGQPTRDPAGHVEVWASEVWLTLSEQDEERLRTLTEARKDELVWDHQRRWERSRREYLSEDVLHSPGSAVVWWLSRNEDKIEGTVNLIGHLARLSAAAHDAEVPELFRHLDPIGPAPAVDLQLPAGPHRAETAEDYVGRLIDLIGFGAPGKESEQALLAERFAGVIEAAERPDLANAVRRRFGHAWEAEPGDGELNLEHGFDDESPARSDWSRPEVDSPVSETDHPSPMSDGQEPSLD
jgi:hypothetical protein